MNEEINSEELKKKSEKFDKIIQNNSEMVLSEFEKVLGRSLEEKEKVELEKSMKVFFMITSLMMQTMM